METVIVIAIVVVGFVFFSNLGNRAAERFARKETASESSQKQPPAREVDVDHDVQYWTDRRHVGYPLRKE